MIHSQLALLKLIIDNVSRDSLFVCFASPLTSIYGGFLCFSVLGYVAQNIGKEVADVIASGARVAVVVCLGLWCG